MQDATGGCRVQKEQILRELRESRAEFLDAIEGLDESEIMEPGVVGEWSIKDLLAHLNRWEGELVTMLWQVKEGRFPDRPEISGQDQIDEINRRWYLESRDRPLDMIESDFRALRPQTIRRVEAFSTEELNDPDFHKALRGEPLWRWIEVDTFEHEREHAEQVRRWRTSRRA